MVSSRSVDVKLYMAGWKNCPIIEDEPGYDDDSVPVELHRPLEEAGSEIMHYRSAAMTDMESKYAGVLWYSAQGEGSGAWDSMAHCCHT
jgi:hypothetical protein